MKHYLDLIAISAGRHKKQTRMTRLCIVLAVFLVTVIFGMAVINARPMATLCCCPPESCPGRCLRRFVNPSTSSISSTRVCSGFR